MQTIQHASAPLATAISAIGTERFGASMMAFARGWLDADQLMVFRIRPREGVATLIAENSLGGSRQAQALADLYRISHHDHDPNATLLMARPSARETTTCRAMTRADIHDPAYREALYDRPGLASKVAMVRQSASETLYLNLYRRRERASFGDDALGQLAISGEVILALIDRHVALSARASGHDPAAFLYRLETRGVRLSAREATVCALLIQGRSMRAIALELGVSTHSAISYRRRAFEKLNISTQKELFGLALRSGQEPADMGGD